MTTQELKQQIEKVLGNDIRCLLPSYWWKRLFSLTLDKVDEKLDAANIKTINGESVIGEGNLKVGITSVSSMEELNILEVEAGDVATVASREYGKINPYACYRLTSEPTNKNVIIENWDKFKRITHIDALMPEESVGEFTSIVLHAYASYRQDACQLTYTGRSYVIKVGNSSDYVSYTLEELNNLLKESDYRLMAVSDGDVSQEVIDRYVSLYSPDVIVSDAYIKGDTWTRLLKEGEGGSNITVDSELSATSENPVQNKVIYENLYGMCEEYTQMYEELGASVHEVTADIYTKLLKKVDYVAGKQLSTEDFTTALKTKLEGLNNYDDTSIQNAVNSLTTQINTLVSGDASAAIESFNEIIAFLNGVEDSESLDSIIASIEQQIAAKQDKLVSGTNIKTINGESILGEGNIVVNVDTSNLATKEELNAKQDKISDLETIRSGAAKGATALQEHQDISHLASKEELQNLQNEVIANEEVVAAAFNDVNERINAISENVGGTTVTKEELESAVETINQTISDNKSATDTAIEGLETSIGNVDAKFANYATTESLNGAIETINNTIVENEEITATAINDLNTRLAALEAAIANL